MDYTDASYGIFHKDLKTWELLPFSQFFAKTQRPTIFLKVYVFIGILIVRQNCRRTYAICNRQISCFNMFPIQWKIIIESCFKFSKYLIKILPSICAKTYWSCQAKAVDGFFNGDKMYFFRQYWTVFVINLQLNRSNLAELLRNRERQKLVVSN